MDEEPLAEAQSEAEIETSTEDDSALPEIDGMDEQEMSMNGTSAGWRIEVNNRGATWNWRKGSGINRKGRKGGKFRELSQERQQAYEKRRRH